MGRSVLSPTRLLVETMSPMSFIVILLVIGSINADIENGEDGNLLTEPTSTDTGFPVNDDDVYNDNNDDEASRYKRKGGAMGAAISDLVALVRHVSSAIGNVDVNG